MSILLLNPGQMGEQVGAALRGVGHEVFWVEEGRGNATRQRAANAGLTGQTTLAAALSASEFVLSVVPPHAAVSTAETVAEHQFQGVRGLQRSLAGHWCAGRQHRWCRGRPLC